MIQRILEIQQRHILSRLNVPPANQQELVQTVNKALCCRNQ